MVDEVVGVVDIGVGGGLIVGGIGWAVSLAEGNGSKGLSIVIAGLQNFTISLITLLWEMSES